MTLSDETARLILERIQSRSQIVCGLTASIRISDTQIHTRAQTVLIDETMRRLTEEVRDLLKLDAKDAHLGARRQAE